MPLPLPPRPLPSPDYLTGYPPELIASVQRMIEAKRLGEVLLRKYPQAHAVRTDTALYDYVRDIKDEYLRNVGQVSKVAFDGKLQTVRQALGSHTRIARVQGTKLKSKREIRIATVFREMPAPFLRMIVVHELAHIKESVHGKDFYQLCRHMEPDYHQLEFDLRAYLNHLAAGGEPLWSVAWRPDDSPVRR